MYIRWALDEHLTDVSTNVQVSEQEAQTAATELYTTIYKWMQDHRMCSSLIKDATTNICYWTLKNCPNPLWILLSNDKNLLVQRRNPPHLLQLYKPCPPS
jgi:hypothetical protein